MENLWFSSVAILTQEGSNPRLILDLILSGLNTEDTPKAPREDIRFGCALRRIPKRILVADPQLGLVYPSKADLSDA